MTAAAHIAGPYVFDLDDGTVQHAESGMVLAVVSGVDNFPCRDEEKDEEFEAQLVATGHLLAAAPNLLQAGKHLAVKLAEAYRIAKCDPAKCQAIADFMAAVAKAEGR